MSDNEHGGGRNFTMHVPTEQATGVYANVVGVWHSQFEFTMDFGVLNHPAAAVDPTQPSATLVARVKIPTAVMFDIASVIAHQVDEYEKAFGPISRPEAGPPLYPPAP